MNKILKDLSVIAKDSLTEFSRWEEGKKQFPEALPTETEIVEAMELFYKNTFIIKGLKELSRLDLEKAPAHLAFAILKGRFTQALKTFLPDIYTLFLQPSEDIKFTNYFLHLIKSSPKTLYVWSSLLNLTYMQKIPPKILHQIFIKFHSSETVTS